MDTEQEWIGMGGWMWKRRSGRMAEDREGIHVEEEEGECRWGRRKREERGSCNICIT